MEEGKSLSACWCLNLSPIDNLEYELNECICKSCYNKVASPCKRECKLDGNQVCIICKRTLLEIKLWTGFTLEQKLTTITQLENRK